MVDPIFQSDNFKLAEKMLDAAALRQQAIASNIANVDTPGYRRVDVAADFATQLKASFKAGEKDVVDTLQPKLAEDPLARTIRPDGNSVELEHELLAMDKNSMDYNYLSEVVSQNIKQLKIAISGHSG